MTTLQASRTALLLVDVQSGILALPLAPAGADTVLGNSARLAAGFRARKAVVAMSRVAWSADFSDALQQPVDRPLPMPEGGLPANWAELPGDLGVEATDVVFTKRQWNAFHGTELDLQLRRRGVKTLVIAGIATNMGVESTARAGHELGYELVFASDAITSVAEAMHTFAMQTIFPMIGRVRTTDEILSALR